MKNWGVLVCASGLVAASLAPAHAQTQPQVQAAPNPPSAGTYNETPQSLNCIYQLGTQVAGCNPNNSTLINSFTNLGSHAIVVVTPVHDANLATSLAAYSAQFGLPTPNLTVVTNSSAATCNDKVQNSDVATTFNCYQLSTDVIEVAHAIAPQAALVVVEIPNSAQLSDLAAGIDAATTQAKAAGGGEVVLAQGFVVTSESYIYEGLTEDSSETSVESHLQPSAKNQSVLYFALSGAEGSLFYPGTSPNVVSVSPSSISRDMENPNDTGTFLGERSGDSGAGGLSAYLAAPSYQNRIANRIGNSSMRAVPDVTTAGNANANVWVYNTSSSGGAWVAASGGYMAVGIAAAIANASKASDSFLSTSALLTRMYAKIGTASFADIAIGTCGAYESGLATVADRNSPLNQWDFCSGIGAPRGTTGFGP